MPVGQAVMIKGVLGLTTDSPSGNLKNIHRALKSRAEYDSTGPVLLSFCNRGQVHFPG